MLGNCEKMLVISSTTNEWPQNQVDEKGLMASSTGMIMEKPTQQDQQLQQQQALKCPRCDSSNTKFCYYNNYSLSQPRHFCKACKRYWTRGGTLRNVPVGGGCRKNKRVKKPISAVDSSLSSSAPPALTTNSNPNVMDLSSTSNHINPLFYGLPTNPSELNLQYPRFSSRVFDFQPHMNDLGLGFSSGLMDYQNGFNNKQIQDSNSLVSSYPIFGSSTSAATNSTPTMASLIASSLQQQKFMGFKPYEQVQMEEVKTEESRNRLDWNISCQNQMEQIGSSTDPSVLWNPTWLDPANIGSSVTSLI